MATADAPYPVVEASQVGQVRRAAQRLAEIEKFSDEIAGQVAIVATELAANLAKYGRSGQVFLQPLREKSGTTIQVLAVDSGPGIADVQRSLQDGVSTGGTPGTGLGAVRRLSRYFDIFSMPGHGTVVLSRIGNKRAAKSSGFQCAALSTAAPGETMCGDAWRITERDDHLAIMIADGLGHGPLAAEAADRAAELFDETAFQDAPAAFCERAHRALSGTRGAALACAVLTKAGRVSYAGVGNIAGTIVAGDKSRGLSSQNGTIGAQLRRVQGFDYDLPERGVLVMHSDGLTNRWSLDTYPGLASRDASVIAAVLHRDCLRGKDDATVTVVKRVARS